MIALQGTPVAGECMYVDQTRRRRHSVRTHGPGATGGRRRRVGLGLPGVGGGVGLYLDLAQGCE